MLEQKHRILIVDDESLNINFLNSILKMDYHIKVAINGQEALRRAISDPKPDMILLDINMVDMDGYEVCQRLKEDPATRDIPVIFITAMTEEEDEEKGLSMGAVDYIFKPLRPSIILARVKTHLGLKQARESLVLRNFELESFLTLRETIENISRHDLKTPLNGILGATQVLLEEAYIQPEHKALIAMQERAGYKMLEMINRSLDMLKMEQGNYILEPKPVDILKLIRHILTETQHPVFQLQVDGRPATTEQTFHIQGEELLCYSMLSNLIKNASEAGPPNSPITIFMSTQESGVVKIHNQGVVPREIREQFFEKYITSGKKAGTGLGSYSARLITETLGGKIRMETSEKTGTTITMDLPLPQTKSCQKLRDETHEFENTSDKPSDKCGMAILMADDTTENHIVISAFLKNSIHRLTIVENGVQALEKFKNSHFDLVLMDIHMPKMDGYRAIQEIRNWEASQNRPPIPVLALTASSDKEEIEKFRLAGFNRHISKPINKKHFLEVISNY